MQICEQEWRSHDLSGAVQLIMSFSGHEIVCGAAGYTAQTGPAIRRMHIFKSLKRMNANANDVSGI